jgi:protein-tyrosine phosphatase
MSEGMFEVLPNLYISTYNTVRLSRDEFFQVNCTKDLPMVRENGFRIAIDDDPFEVDNMLRQLYTVVEIIDEELHIHGRKVVVHCLAAVSRSPSVICAYLMWKLRIPLRDAIRYVRKVRKEAFSFSMNFREALERYESQLNNSDTIK